MEAKSEKIGRHDAVEINTFDRAGLDYWRRELGVSESRIQEAIGRVGPRLGKVRGYLAKHPTPSE